MNNILKITLSLFGSLLWITSVFAADYRDLKILRLDWWGYPELVYRDRLITGPETLPILYNLSVNSVEWKECLCAAEKGDVHAATIVFATMDKVLGAKEKNALFIHLWNYYTSKEMLPLLKKLPLHHPLLTYIFKYALLTKDAAILRTSEVKKAQTLTYPILSLLLTTDRGVIKMLEETIEAMKLDSLKKKQKEKFQTTINDLEMLIRLLQLKANFPSVNFHPLPEPTGTVGCRYVRASIAHPTNKVEIKKLADEFFMPACEFISIDAFEDNRFAESLYYYYLSYVDTLPHKSGEMLLGLAVVYWKSGCSEDFHILYRFIERCLWSSQERARIDFDLLKQLKRSFPDTFSQNQEHKINEAVQEMLKGGVYYSERLEQLRMEKLSRKRATLFSNSKRRDSGGGDSADKKKDL